MKPRNFQTQIISMSTLVSTIYYQTWIIKTAVTMTKIHVIQFASETPLHYSEGTNHMHTCDTGITNQVQEYRRTVI